MENLKKKLKIVGIIFLILVALLIYFIFFTKPKTSTPTSSPTPISILSATPPNDSTGISVFDPILVTFNQSVDSSTLSVTSDPVEDWTIVQLGQNSIQLKHKLYLRVSTNYSINIMQHGSEIGKLVYQTAHEQNDPRQLQGLKSELERDYPLISLTPYSTPDYTVVYSDVLTLEIDLKSSSALSKSDAILQVESWVNSHGVSPNSHKYTVITATPASGTSPSPTP